MSNRIVRALEDGARKIGKSLAEDGAKAVKDFYHSTAENLKRVAKNTTEADAKHADDLKAILDGDKGDLPHEPHSPGGGGRPGGGHDEPSLGEPGGPGQHSDGNGGCTTGGDPVDVVSGQMIDSATDLELPGLLPLVLSRSYASGYTGGRRFGPGWSSTLDQRVAVDDHGIHYAGDDAQVLHYPLPAPGETALPVDGARLELSLDPNDDTVRIQDPRTGWTLHFEPVTAGAGVRPLSALTDRNGHRIDYRYDASGLPTEVEHSGGYRIAVDTVHTSAGPRIEALRLLDGTDHGTTVASYGYDARGRLTDILNSSGTPLVYGYDSDDRITSWTDRNGYWYAYEYDADGRVVRGYGADGVLDAGFEYDTRQQVTTVTDSLGQRSQYHYDEFHHVTLTVDPLGGSVRTEYDRYGRLLSFTDALGRSTRFTLDAAGDTVMAERPDGSALEFEYNDLRLPTLGRSPDGLIRRQSYDEQGNRTSSTDPSGAVTRYGYDRDGRLASITDADGATVRIRCNRAGLVTEAYDAQGHRTAFDYDAFGRPVAVTDPLGGTTTRTWTPEGLISTRTAADGATESWSYDGEGNLLTHTDPSGATTRYEYAHFNQVASVSTAAGTRYSFDRDRELRLTRVTDPQGLTWTYRYNETGLPVEETDYNDRTLGYSYDRAGALVSRTNGLGQTVTVDRDLLGRPTARHFDGRSIRYTYDAGDRLLHAESPDCVLTRGYDLAGQLTSETVNGRTISYDYDPFGRLSTRRTPTGTLSSWTYDGTGLPASLTVGGHAIEFTRDAAGREVNRRIGAGLDLASGWDSENRLTSQALSSAGRREILQHRGYAYRADGSPVATADAHTGSRQYELDPAGRVTAVRSAGTAAGGESSEVAESYEYDPSGNLVDADWPGQREGSAKGVRGYSGTLIRSAGRTRFEHDAQGRAVRRIRTTLSGRQQSWEYTWDAEDRLTDVTTPDGARWHYLYDPVGRRVAKQRLDVAEDGSTSVAEWTDFTWSGYTLAEQTAHSPRLPGPYTQSWDYDGDRPVAQSEHLGDPGAGTPQDEIDRRFFAIITDLVGAPTRLVDLDGATVWQPDATLWGLSTPQPGSTDIPLRFPGQYYDPETRLHYNVHRYYDPATARYLTADPLGLDPAPNPHAYVVNPLTWFDPLGLAGVDESDVTWGGRVSYGARDHLHRATSVTATLHPDMMGGKTSPKFDPVGWVTGKGYNRAHLLGAQLGGSNKDPRNFVTMHQYANTPIMRDLEGQVRAAVDKGEIVKYTVTAHYSGNDLLPKGVTIEAHGNRGFQFQPRGSSSPTNSISICNRKK